MADLIETREGQYVRPERVDAVEATGKVGGLGHERTNFRLLVGGTWIVGSTNDFDALLARLDGARVVDLEHETPPEGN